MDFEKAHRENGAAWDITAAIYERDEQKDIEFLRARGNSLLPPEQAVVGNALKVEYFTEQFPVTVAAVGLTALFDPENARMKG